jgi:hypothetical protein
MTTYSAITNGEIDQDSPGTEVLFAKLRDNPIAIAEGASGAPKVELDALEIAETTATGTINVGGAAVTITRPSTRSLFPNTAVTAGNSADLQVELNDVGLILNNTGGGNVSYSVVWPYLRNTP